MKYIQLDESLEKFGSGIKNRHVYSPIQNIGLYIGLCPKKNLNHVVKID